MRGNHNHYYGKDGPGYKHGLTKTPFYKVWQSMKRRCIDPNHIAYKYYGGDGITVCNKWLKFEGFYRDMFSSYRKGLTIERLNNKIGYNRKNCVWATMKTQSRNRKNNHKVIYKNKEYVVADLAEKLGIKYGVFYNRMFIYKLPIELCVRKDNMRGKNRDNFLIKKL